MCPHGVAAVLPTLFEGMLAQKWQTNEGACKMLQALATRCPGQVAVCMPEIVPKATEALGNARQAVKDAAAAAMSACMSTVNNKDLEQFIPMLIDTMQNPVKVPDCVHKLAATTFVQVRQAGGRGPSGPAAQRRGVPAAHACSACSIPALLPLVSPACSLLLTRPPRCPCCPAPAAGCGGSHAVHHGAAAGARPAPRQHDRHQAQGCGHH